MFDSGIFFQTFEFDEWPGTHTIPEKFIRPYTGSLFNLREGYRDVFPEKQFAPVNDAASVRDSMKGSNPLPADTKIVDSSKIFKIKYSINLLPSLEMYVNKNTDPKVKGKEYTNKDTHMMRILSEQSQLDLFDTHPVLELIEFKWNKFARKHHSVGWYMHLLYIFTIILYINLVYIQNNGTKED